MIVYRNPSYFSQNVENMSKFDKAKIWGLKDRQTLLYLALKQKLGWILCLTGRETISSNCKDKTEGCATSVLKHFNIKFQRKSCPFHNYISILLYVFFGRLANKNNESHKNRLLQIWYILQRLWRNKNKL